MSITNSDLLINVLTGEYPLNLIQVRAANPLKSFAEFPSEDQLAELGYAKVNYTERPIADVVREGNPIIVDGKWVQYWLSRDFNAQEHLERFNDRKAAKLQAVRDLTTLCLERGCRHQFPDSTTCRIQLRDGDRANLAGLRLRALQAKQNGSIETFAFRTYENVTKMGLSADQIVVMSDVAFDKYMMILGICWGFKDAIEAATDDSGFPEVPENLDSYGV